MSHRQSDSRRFYCFVAFTRMVPLEDLVAALGTAAIGARLAGPVRTPEPDRLVLPMASGKLFVLLMPQSLPCDMLIGDPAQKFAWPDWQQESATWRSHVLIATEETEPELPEACTMAKDVLRVACAFAVLHGANGAGWDGSGLFYSASTFLEMCAEAPLPAELVVRCTWRKVTLPGGPCLAVRSSGLDLFDLPEVDFADGEGTALVIGGRVLDLARYLLAHGPVIKDGDTVGLDERRESRVRIEDDARGWPVLVVRPNDA